MSLLDRLKFYRALDQSALNGKLTLDELLLNPNSIIAIRQKLPNLLYFVYNHYLDLINCAIGKTSINQHTLNDESLFLLLELPEMIFRSIDNRFQFFLEIIEFLTTNTVNPHFVENSIKLLIHFIERTKGKILKKFNQANSEIIFKNIFTLSDRMICDELFYTITQYPKELKGFLVRFDSFSILVTHLQTPNEIVLKRVLQFSYSLIDLFKFDVPYLLFYSKDVFINSVLRISFEFNLFHELCFKYIHKITQCSQVTSTFVVNLLNHLQVFHDFIVNSEKFESSHYYLILIICHLIKNIPNFSDLIANIFVFLLKIFFEFPFNTFLHNSFVYLFEELSVLSEYSMFIQETNIMNIIAMEFHRRYEIQANYWGHLHKLTSLINVMIEAKMIESNEIWDKYLIEVHIPISNVMERRYGGPIQSLVEEIEYAYEYEEEEEYEENGF